MKPSIFNSNGEMLERVGCLFGHTFGRFQDQIAPLGYGFSICYAPESELGLHEHETYNQERTYQISEIGAGYEKYPEIASRLVGHKI